MLDTLVEEIDNGQWHVGNVSKEMENLRKNQKNQKYCNRNEVSLGSSKIGYSQGNNWWTWI